MNQVSGDRIPPNDHQNQEHNRSPGEPRITPAETRPTPGITKFSLDPIQSRIGSFVPWLFQLKRCFTFESISCFVLHGLYPCTMYGEYLASSVGLGVPPPAPQIISTVSARYQGTLLDSSALTRHNILTFKCQGGTHSNQGTRRTNQRGRGSAPTNK